MGLRQVTYGPKINIVRVKSSDCTWRHLYICGEGVPEVLERKIYEGMHNVCLCSILVDGVLLQATFSPAQARCLFGKNLSRFLARRNG